MDFLLVRLRFLFAIWECLILLYYFFSTWTLHWSVFALILARALFFVRSLHTPVLPVLYSYGWYFTRTNFWESNLRPHILIYLPRELKFLSLLI